LDSNKRIETRRKRGPGIKGEKHIKQVFKNQSSFLIFETAITG
jgi:hypothetical protein